jgi:uncharacterized protein YigA (DUF484 family)
MAVDANDLAARLKRISELTERLLAMQNENEAARTLAARISQEIAVAREQIRAFNPREKIGGLPLAFSKAKVSQDSEDQ